jgi:hypothetical protein
MLRNKLVELAKAELGKNITETSKNQGPEIEKYWSATWYKDGYKNREPYCAAFICWLFQQGMKDNKFTFENPQTPSAFGFEGWCLKQDRSVLLKRSGKISKGDLVIFNFSHIGIAIADEKDGLIVCIEANTSATSTGNQRDGGGVYQKTRKRSLIRSFVKIMV